jgi:hypothetical protein
LVRSVRADLRRSGPTSEGRGRPQKVGGRPQKAGADLRRSGAASEGRGRPQKVGGGLRRSGAASEGRGRPQKVGGGLRRSGATSEGRLAGKAGKTAFSPPPGDDRQLAIHHRATQQRPLKRAARPSLLHGASSSSPHPCPEHAFIACHADAGGWKYFTAKEAQAMAFRPNRGSKMPQPRSEPRVEKAKLWRPAPAFPGRPRPAGSPDNLWAVDHPCGTFLVA